MQTKRGWGFLTTMAILLALAAIGDVLKPFGQQGPITPASFLPRIRPRRGFLNLSASVATGLGNAPSMLDGIANDVRRLSVSLASPVQQSRCAAGRGW